MVLGTPSDGKYRQTSKEINANANVNARCARALKVCSLLGFVTISFEIGSTKANANDRCE